MEKATLREEILRHIAMPVIPDHDLQATTRGIYPDTGENLTRALQNAIDDLSERGGGRLSLSAGVWRSGALQLLDLRLFLFILFQALLVAVLLLLHVKRIVSGVVLRAPVEDLDDAPCSSKAVWSFIWKAGTQFCNSSVRK